MESESEYEEHCVLNEVTTRKRKKFGRVSDANKKLNLQSHTPGPDCQCKHLKCFENVPQNCRKTILLNFNLMNSVDEQNTYLCGLITVQPIQNRRPRLGEDEASFRDAAYSYRVRFMCDETVKEVQVCQQAFRSIHGIGKKKLQILQRRLKSEGKAPRDGRGKHNVRPNKLSEDAKRAIVEHIGSFKGRKGHYNLSESKKIYLPEELNIKKMFDMFCCKHENIKVSYETYRTIFSTEFNISFGFPRMDTCSTCDEYIAKSKTLNAEKLHLNVNTDIDKIEQKDAELKRLRIENIVHKKKAERFYERKRIAKFSSRKNVDLEAICFDFQKNLPVPNLSTNDVYYRRQLSVYTFNVHILSSGTSVFYTYPQTVGSKGSDEVCSMIHDFVYNYLDLKVRRLRIFCDSCGGQNKNWNVFRFLHNLVHEQHRFDEIIVCFPIRGHSYMETDKNMGIIKQKTRVELPCQWAEVFRQARVKPRPFDVVEADQSMFRNWSGLLNSMYVKKCPFKSRPIRELKITGTHPRFIFHRSSYSGHFDSAVVCNRQQRKRRNLADNEFILPDYLYEDLIPVPKAKFEDVKHLAKFCDREAREYLQNLPYK